MKYHSLVLLLLLNTCALYVQAQCPFTASANSGCREDQFCFTANVDPATVTSYAWTFGDGNSATGSANVCHSYPGTGPTGNSYTVTLTLVDTAGMTCSSNQTVTILPFTQFLGAITPPEDCQLNLDSTATSTVRAFILDSVLQPNIFPLTYDFGNGNVFTVNSYAQDFTFNCFGSHPIKIFQNGQTCPTYVDTFNFYTDIVTSFELSGTSSFFCEGTGTSKIKMVSSEFRVLSTP